MTYRICTPQKSLQKTAKRHRFSAKSCIFQQNPARSNTPVHPVHSVHAISRNYMNNDLAHKLSTYGCAKLLANSGISLTETMLESLSKHIDLLKEWNAFASLVSPGDIDKIVETHLVDSLSLAPWVLKACRDGATLLDIGSGGGFPAIPIKILLPEIRLALVERSERKVGFLSKAVGALNLSSTKVYLGTFPKCVATEVPKAITARAVEKPLEILPKILEFMPPGSTFLCQFGYVGSETRPMFHVERIEDEWTIRGLRRGHLHLITHPPQCST
jgi:16S rRNA (guanine527-N7)-methyltransferase